MATYKVHSTADYTFHIGNVTIYRLTVDDMQYRIGFYPDHGVTFAIMTHNPLPVECVAFDSLPWEGVF